MNELRERLEKQAEEYSGGNIYSLIKELAFLDGATQSVLLTEALEALKFCAFPYQRSVLDFEERVRVSSEAIAKIEAAIKEGEK